MNEYGLFRENSIISCESENQIFAALGLSLVSIPIMPGGCQPTSSKERTVSTYSRGLRRIYSRTEASIMMKRHFVHFILSSPPSIQISGCPKKKGIYVSHGRWKINIPPSSHTQREDCFLPGNHTLSTWKRLSMPPPGWGRFRAECKPLSARSRLEILQIRQETGSKDSHKPRRAQYGDALPH